MASENIQIPQEGQLSDLAAWIAGDLGSAYARLYISNTPFLPTRVCTDYTEASFTGYAPANPLAFGTPFVNGAQVGETDSGALNWNYTAGAGTADVFGIYVTDAAKTKLLAVIPFLSPVTLSPSNNTLTRVIQLTCISQV